MLCDYKPMTSKVSLKVENNILKCFMTGKKSIDEGLIYWQQIVDKCEKENLSRIQVSLAVTGRFSPFEAIGNYQLIINILKQVDIKIAIIDLNNSSASDTQICCNMAVSQGLNLCYFESQQEASSWLLADTDDPGKFAR